MIELLIISFAFVALCFGFVVAFGAPYLPTLKPQTVAAFELLDLQKGQTLIELGSGDGRVLKEAARRGYKAIGYEINPLLYLFSLAYTWKYRRLVKVHCRNFWHTQLPDADGVFVFLLDKYMKKLNKKMITNYPQGMKVVSFAFKIPGEKIVKTKDGVFLYRINRDR